MSKVDVLPSPAELARTPVQRAEIQRLVQREVAEILAAHEQFVFEPFFRSRQVAYELKRLMTVSQQKKWSVYYERFGCLICETHERNHVGNGMCDRCYPCTFQRLRQIDGEVLKNETPRAAREAFRAERLLPENALRDGIHHTLYKRSTPEELLLYRRVAEQLSVQPNFVRRVATGVQLSERIAAAIKKEHAKMLTEDLTAVRTSRRGRRISSRV